MAEEFLRSINRIFRRIDEAFEEVDRAFEEAFRMVRTRFPELTKPLKAGEGRGFVFGYGFEWRSPTAKVPRQELERELKKRVKVPVK